MNDIKKWLTMLGEEATVPQPETTDIEPTVAAEAVEETAPEIRENAEQKLEESLNQIGSEILTTVVEAEAVDEAKGSTDWQSILKSDKLMNYLETALSMLVDLKKETGYHEDRVAYLSMVKRLLMQPTVEPEELSRVHSQFLHHLVDQMRSIVDRMKGANRRYPQWEKYIEIISNTESMLRDAIKASGSKLYGVAPDLMKLLKKERIPGLAEDTDADTADSDDGDDAKMTRKILADLPGFKHSERHDQSDPKHQTFSASGNKVAEVKNYLKKEGWQRPGQGSMWYTKPGVDYEIAVEMMGGKTYVSLSRFTSL